MIAHFVNNDTEINIKNHREQAKQYRNMKGKYSNFPKTDDKIAIEDFTQIEKVTGTSIYLYQLIETSNKEFEIIVIRNPKIIVDDKERHICLIQILENDHVALINDFDQFVDVIRNCNNIAKRDVVYCKLCLQGISPDKYENHFEN